LAAATAAVVIATIGAGLLVVGRNTVPVASPSSVPTTDIASPSAASPSATSSIPRYSDGIPRTFEGQPVLRWADALARRTMATDDTPFLVGVWLDVPTGIFSCPADHGPDPSAPNSWVYVPGGCQFSYISADAGIAPTNQHGVTTFRFYQGKLATGPAIMQVHVHDPRATQCGYQEPICHDMIVVDDIPWTGDAATAPHPLSVDQVIAATRSVSAASGLQPSGPIGYTGCGADVTDGLGLCPPPISGAPYPSPIAGAAVLPSPEALARALPTLTPGVDGALMASAVDWTGGGTYGSWDYRWLVVDNVAVLVRTAIVTPSQSDVEFLNRLAAALKAQEVNPSPGG
jgi:hypothetical protein